MIAECRLAIADFQTIKPQPVKSETAIASLNRQSAIAIRQ
jgi:hypothetical protein